MQPVVQEFVERVGMETRAEELARTAGRVFAYMVLRGGPCPAEELADELDVSRGGVSMSTRYLESRGLLERTGRPGDQKVYYRIPADPYGNLVEETLERRRRIREITREARRGVEAAELGSEFGGAAERLGRMEAFYDLVVRRMEEGLEEWRSSSASPSGDSEEREDDGRTRS